jgi:1,4-dihydroxy-2-naphthoate polyprenyltransferase
MPAAEPTLAAYRNPLARYVAATRPAFLSVTLVGCVLGLASAQAGGAVLRPLEAFLTLAFALVAHAGINVLNDYYDALNGSDAANTERRFPFTGGSRFIQNGVLTLRATGIFGYALLASVVPAGLWLAHASAPGLLWIGLAGLAVGWAYSAPPFKLMSRGLGEAPWRSAG